MLLALVSGVALALAFPLFNLTILAWVAPAGLILAALNQKPGFAFLLGWLQGILFYGLSVPWIYGVMRQYGPLDVPDAAGVFVLVILAAGAFHGAFAWGIAAISRSGAERACVAAPFLYVGLEKAILHVPDVGFPWNLLGYAAAGNLAFVQLAPLTGVYGLSFLVAAFNALTAWMILSISKKRWSALASWTGAVAVLLAVAFAGPQFVPRAEPDHIAHLVQTNFPQSLSYPNNWSDSHASELDQLQQISIAAAEKSPGLVVWPEVPAPFSLQYPWFLPRAVHVARDTGNGFLLGVVDWKPPVNGHTNATNSAALLDSYGALEFTYDKIHLVPFGEYVPWRKWIGFAGKLTADIGDFQHGTQYKLGRLPGGRFGVFICYEAIFPNEVRRFTAGGAELLINLSNDGWFGGSAAPAQHLAMARVRAVENRRWLLRDTNNGITVSVDPYGRIMARMSADVRDELDAPYAFRSDLTLYARWGDWFPWLCVIAALVLLLWSAAGAPAHRTS